MPTSKNNNRIYKENTKMNITIQPEGVTKKVSMPVEEYCQRKARSLKDDYNVSPEFIKETLLKILDGKKEYNDKGEYATF